MKFKTLIVAFVAALVLAACATTGAPKLNPSQVFAIACPPVQAAITQFAALDAVMIADPAVVKAGLALQKVQPIVASACTVGATVTAANIQDFAQSVLPALGQVAGTLPLPPAQAAQIQAGLIAAEIAVGAAGVVEQQIQAAKVVPAPALPVAKP